MTTVLEATNDTLRLQRTFNAPIGRVWAAWTDPNQVYRWFGCPDSRGLGAEIDLKVGGVYSVTLFSHGREMTMNGKITEVDAPHCLKFEFSWAGDEEFGQLPTTRVSIELAEVKGGTQLMMTHTGFPNAEICNEHQKGWGASLDKVSGFVTSAEAEIFEAIAEWDQAVWKKDSAAIVKDYAPDATLFDLGCQTDSAEATKQLWEACFPYFGDHITLHRKNVRIHTTQDSAMLTCLSRCAGMKMPESCEPSDMMRSWFRVSVFYQKINGRWTVLHEHISMPINCESEKPAYILD